MSDARTGNRRSGRLFFFVPLFFYFHKTEPTT
jgi:hypothetical protein